MRFSISKILECIAKRQRRLRSLDSSDLKLQLDGAGGVKCYAGNCTVVFPVEYRGEPYALRCYMQPKENLREIYGDRYYPNELDGMDGSSADVVLTPWVEGMLLTRVVEICCKEHNESHLRTLSDNFCRFAQELLSEEWAHGDLSGDNIIVSSDLSLHLIDFDSCYLPEFAGRERTELGNSSYRSPFLTHWEFNKHIDNYPVAIIAASLRALSYDPTLKERFGVLDSLLITARECTKDDNPLLGQIQKIFAEEGDFVAYELCRAIKSCDVIIEQLPNLLRFQNAQRNAHRNIHPARGSRLERWGYKDQESDVMVIPQLFDYASNFNEDRALVRLDKWWYIINRHCNILKPLGYMNDYPEEYDTIW